MMVSQVNGTSRETGSQWFALKHEEEKQKNREQMTIQNERDSILYLYSFGDQLEFKH